MRKIMCKRNVTSNYKIARQAVIKMLCNPRSKIHFRWRWKYLARVNRESDF